MGKPFDIIVPIDTCIDLIVDCGKAVPEFQQVEQFVEGYSFELGGSCGIFASGCAKLGLKTAGVGVVGDDLLGGLVKGLLGEAGVDTSYIRVDGNVKTSIGVSLVREGGDRAILASKGSINSVGIHDFADGLLSQARHFHIGSYFLMRQLIEGYPALLEKAKGYGMTVSLDTNWDPENKWDGNLREVFKYTDFFFPNERELLAIFGGSGVEEALAAAGRHIPVVAAKMGEKGAVACAGGETFAYAQEPVPVVDAIGAGDNFDAGFLYGYLNGLDTRECLKAGCLCGSASVAKAGGVGGQLYKEGLVALADKAP